MSSFLLPLLLSRCWLETRTKSPGSYSIGRWCRLSKFFFIVIFAFSSARFAISQLVCICVAKWSAAGTVSFVVISEGCPIRWHPLFSQKGVNPVALCNELLYANSAVEIQSVQSLCFSANILRYFPISRLT